VGFFRFKKAAKTTVAANTAANAIVEGNSGRWRAIPKALLKVRTWAIAQAKNPINFFRQQLTEPMITLS
jgi:uncharacterized protein YdaT